MMCMGKPMTLRFQAFLPSLFQFPQAAVKLSVPTQISLLQSTASGELLREPALLFPKSALCNISPQALLPKPFERKYFFLGADGKLGNWSLTSSKLLSH